MAFGYKLELEDGTPADPPAFVSAMPTWRRSDRIFISPGLKYRVVEAREGVLVVERE